MAEPEGLTFYTGTCRGGPCDGKLMDHHERTCVVRGTRPEPTGKYVLCKGVWEWKPAP